MSKKNVFVTTGDIKDIVTSKRALGMANPLSKLGWDVHIVMEDAVENKNRVSLECTTDVKLHYFSKTTAIDELKIKTKINENNCEIAACRIRK